MRKGTAVTLLLTAISCGRAALDVPPPAPLPDGGFDAGIDAGLDAAIRDAGFDAARPDAGFCVPGRATLPAGALDIVFAIDGSTSMGWIPPSSTEGLTRREMLRAALGDAFRDLDPRARTGALFFPSGTRCYVEPRLDVSLARDHVDAILDAFDERELFGRSPIGHAIAKAGLALVDEAPDGPNRYVVVITDGHATCDLPGATPAWPTASFLDSRYGIETFSIRVDRAASDPDYRDVAELRGLLRRLADQLGGCVLDVPLERSPDAREELRVGGELVRPGADWRWSGADERSITLLGDACSARLGSNAEVELSLVCP